MTPPTDERSDLDPRLTAMEEDADSWKKVVRGGYVDKPEEKRAKYFCPKCLVQADAKGRCKVCGGILVPVGTAPSVARRMAAGEYPVEGPEDDGDEYGDDDLGDVAGGMPEEDLSGGAHEAIEAGRAPDEGPRADDEVAIPLPVRRPRVKFCSYCGSADIMVVEGQSAFRCRGCGATFRVGAGR